MNVKLQKKNEIDSAGVIATMSANIFMLENLARMEYDSAMAMVAEDLPVTSFFGDWKAAKKMFESLSGRKKPSKKFVGAFRKSSGLEKAIKAMDTASKKNDLAGYKKAFTAYEKTARGYLKLVEKTAKVAVKETDTKIPENMDLSDYNGCVKLLLKQLNNITKDAKEIRDNA